MKLFKKSSPGFTLIELLVVVAIIGILATIILASLQSARGKARFARAQSEVSSMRAAAELAATPVGTYPPGNLVFLHVPSGMSRLVASVEANYPVIKSSSSTGKSWAFSFTDGTSNFCSDSSGYAGPKVATVDNTGEWSCQ